MGVNGRQGPDLIYGNRNALGSGSSGSNNADLSPSMVWGGWGLFDQRVGYNVTRLGAIGWYGTNFIPVVDLVPAALAANNIAASQSPAAGAITLVSTTGAGITVTSTPTVVWGSGNTVPSGALAIDGLPGLVQPGVALANLSTGVTRLSFYDPTKTSARAIRYVSGGNDTGITFTASGYDIYGYPMTETVTGASGGTATGKKAFKFITGITHTGSVAGTLTIGTTDIYGFPLRVDTQGYVDIVWNNTLVTSNTGFTAADATTPATTTTGDVRGTYNVQSASDGTKRLQIFVQPSAANVLSSNPTVGMFGVAQV